jgi:branched-chain amino acid transport system substrate-binding protein
MLRQFFVFALLVGLLVGASACKQKLEGTASTGDNGPIVIGEYGSMTGPEATFGDSTDEGVKLAVKEINEKGGVLGRQIKLIADDDAGKSNETQAVVTRLIAQDHAVAIIGEVASSLSLVGGQICQQQGVPMISPSSTNPKVTAIGNMVSRVCFIDPFQGYVDATFPKINLKLDTAAVLFNKSQAYSTGLAKYFADEFKKMGGKVVAEEAYHDGDNDFSAQLTSIRGANPAFIYIPGYYTEVVAISESARKLGITCPLIGGDGWVSDKLKDAGHALDGCYFSDHYYREDPRAEVQEFIKNYRAAYNHDPDSMAALGYDAAELLFDAMKRAKSLKGEDLAAAINSTKDFKGVTGSITIDENRNARKVAVIQKLDNGIFSYFTTIPPLPQ